MAKVDDLLAQYKVDAVATLEQFRRVYAGEDEQFVPIALAVRWVQALEGGPDIDAIAELVRECDALLPTAPKYGIVFYGFCAKARNKYNALWAASLEGRK
jgi:hypothetical protein